MSGMIMDSAGKRKPGGGAVGGRRRPLDTARTLWLLVAAWAAGITWLSSLSGDSVAISAVGALHMDKALHFGVYLAGGFLLARAWRLSFHTGFLPTLGMAVLVLAVFAGVDEFHQVFVDGRSGADPGDWLADVLGAAAGALISLRIPHRL